MKTRYYVYISGEEGVFVTGKNEEDAVEIAINNGDFTNDQEIFAVPAEGDNAEKEGRRWKN